MRDFLTITLILTAGAIVSTAPFLPAQSVQHHFASIARKKAGGGGGGPTDWTLDASLEGLYYFEGAATHAGMGASETGDNHADDAGTMEAPAAVTNSPLPVEALQSAQFTSTGTDEGLVLTQPNMTSTFPANGTGDGVVTFAAWIRVGDSAATERKVFVCNDSTTSGGANPPVEMEVNSDETLGVNIDAATGNTHYNTTATLTADEWTFVALVYDDAADELAAYIRQHDAGTSTWETTAATAGTIDDMTSSGGFFLGSTKDQIGSTPLEGYMDAAAIFARAFTRAELDSVFLNGWDGDGWNKDWTADASMVAYYYFEGAATHAGMGASETGDNHADDAVNTGVPNQDTTDYIEGVQSADYTTAGTDDGSCLYQANMTTDFPGNGTGDTDITIVAWIKVPLATQSRTIAFVDDSIANDSSTPTAGFSVDGSEQWFLEVDGSVTNGNYTSTVTLGDDVWTMCAMIYEDSTDSLDLYVREATATDSTYEESTANLGTLDDVGASGGFTIGGNADNSNNLALRGSIDALAVFSAALTDDQINGIFAHGYDGDGW